MKKLGLIALLSWVVSTALAEMPHKSVDLSSDIPDLCQTDPAGKFPDKGGDFCGPVSVSNSLMYLAKSSFPKLQPTAASERESQFKIIHRLASKEFMDTVEKDGTSPPRLMTGVQKFIEEAGYKVARLEQQGWKESTKQFPRKAEIPSVEWMKEGLAAKGGAVWLNVGWYKVNAATNEYQRLGGHWVTLVGYGRTRNGADDELMLLIHDPAPRTGMKPLTQRVKLAPLNKGSLQRNVSQGEVRRRDAKGFYEMKGEMKLKSGADTAILDAAVVLEVE